MSIPYFLKYAAASKVLTPVLNVKFFVSIIIPAYNEQESIVDLVKEVTKYGYDYLVINDCSTDNTWKVLLDWEKKYPENFKMPEV